MKGDYYEAVEELKGKGVRWVELHFVDLAGYLHAVTVPLHALDEDAFNKGLGQLDGSSVEGFTSIDESDLVLKPDPSTIAVLPWNAKRARMIADIYLGLGRGRFPKDPRFIAERAEEYAAENGYRVYFGSEVEFMLLNGIEVDVLTPMLGTGYRIHSFEISGSLGEKHINVAYFQKFKKAYHTPSPLDKVLEVRDRIAEYLEDYFGFRIEAHHHEVAALGQVEINFRFGGLRETADKVVTLKYVAKNVAARHGLTAVFMPKPVYGDNGNGMHTHISLWDGKGRNLFYDPSDDYAELSQLGRYFIGGLLEHSRALAAIVAPTTNSYRRLVPGYEAPVYLVWSRANRSAAVRVPVYHKGDEKGKRIEYRPPDPSANPYLAFAAILAAGLDGVRKKIEPGDPVDKNVYSMSEEERRRLGIKELPRSLDEALDELETDMDFLKPVFTKEAIETYIEVKRRECNEVRLYPSPVEIYMYYNI